MRKYTYDYLIVGSGLFGSTFAQIMNGNGKKCLVIDKRGHTGGNIYTKEENNIKIHWYGAHIFHTDNEEVWHYINKFTKFNNYINSPLAYSEGKLYNLPFNMNTFNKLWNVNTPEEAKHKIQEQCSKYKDISQPANLEEQALKLCGDDIYYTFIKEYTEKQWGRPANQLPASIIKRIPFRLTYNNNYFNDPYQGIPKDGYTALTNNLLKDIHVQTYTNYFDNIPYFQSIAEKILFTGCIDEYFEYKFGRLDYRSLKFKHIYLDTDNYQGNAVINYNEAKYPFTRIIEHKHFEFGKQPSTIITKEYPQKYTPSDEPYYPINDEKNLKCFNKYKALAEKNSHVIFGGRLGQYAYFDMDDTIASAISLTQKELSI
jgi:UDP-galactopyranose mutase